MTILDYFYPRLKNYIDFDFTDQLSPPRLKKDGNYYAANTDEQLKPGSSGSPVFLNGEVVGILCAGNYNNDNTPCNTEWPLNLCVFLSSKVILELLETKRFQ